MYQVVIFRRTLQYNSII